MINCYQMTIPDDYAVLLANGCSPKRVLIRNKEPQGTDELLTSVNPSNPKEASLAFGGYLPIHRKRFSALRARGEKDMMPPQEVMLALPRQEESEEAVDDTLDL